MYSVSTFTKSFFLTIYHSTFYLININNMLLNYIIMIDYINNNILYYYNILNINIIFIN